MAPKYKLTYFNGRGLAELIRFLLAYQEEDFEDIRMDQEQWKLFKPTTPFGKMPLLEEEGKPVMAQSMAIARYLAKKSGLAGKDDWENLQIDIIADTLSDARIPIGIFFYEADENVKKAKKETYINETLPFYLKKLDAVVKENGGYLANKKLSWADFAFASLSELFSLACEKPDVTVDYPNLHALKNKIFNFPQIKKWVSKRPETPF